MSSNADAADASDPSTQAISSAPQRFIYSDADMNAFRASETRKELLQLVGAMGKSCCAVAAASSSSNSFSYDPSRPLEGLSPAMSCLHGALEGMGSWVTEIPPDGSARARFGNPSFKIWHRRLAERAPHLVRCILDCYEDRMMTTTSKLADCFDYGLLEECARKGREAVATASVAGREGNGDDNGNDRLPVEYRDDRQRQLVEEISAYLLDGFGHPVRLDYGTGHESSFMVFLLALFKLGCFGNVPARGGDPSSSSPSTSVPPPPSRPSVGRLAAIAISVVSQYLQVTRGVQTDYMLEPAGSHGVWGLDDYHCLPFYFGACQLTNQEEQYSPSSIHENDVLQREGDRLMYFGCIRYIKQLKKGVPFFESSPMLNDISHLPSWTKVKNGLIKLYEGEVLNKRQVVQHFVFGNLFKGEFLCCCCCLQPAITNMRVDLCVYLWPLAPSSAVATTVMQVPGTCTNLFVAFLFFFFSDMDALATAPACGPSDNIPGPPTTLINTRSVPCLSRSMGDLDGIFLELQTLGKYTCGSFPVLSFNAFVLGVIERNQRYLTWDTLVCNL